MPSYAYSNPESAGFHGLLVIRVCALLRVMKRDEVKREFEASQNNSAHVRQSANGVLASRTGRNVPTDYEPLMTSAIVCESSSRNYVIRNGDNFRMIRSS
jgi:hypothetical protein